MARPARPQITAAEDQGRGVGLRRAREAGGVLEWGAVRGQVSAKGGGWKFSGARPRNCERTGVGRDREEE